MERLCQNESALEFVFVAELVGFPPRIIGEGRICPDALGETAEFCVVVADPWQGKGLGRVITDFCLDQARSLGVRRVIAEINPENIRIISLLLSRGFILHRDRQDLALFAELVLREPAAH